MGGFAELLAFECLCAIDDILFLAEDTETVAIGREVYFLREYIYTA